MKRLIVAFALVLLAGGVSAQEFNRLPAAYKWLGNKEVAFTFNGRYTDEECFKLVMPKGKKVEGVQAPEKYADFPLQPEGAVNLTYSPDSTMLAFTRANDLYVVTIADGSECRLTFDGTATVMNGYASWVYYEEILGRPSRYRAFWWSPDSKRIAFYHFDDTEVPMFPIYSPFGQDGKLRETHYPKVGEKNPEVRIGFVDVPAALSGTVSTVWADFDEKEDQYFGIPFWSDDSRTFYVAHEPRIQNTLDLFAVSPVDGSKQVLYHETYPTWLDWIEGMLFTDNGLYMVRAFETGWQQIYFLPRGEGRNRVFHRPAGRSPHPSGPVQGFPEGRHHAAHGRVPECRRRAVLPGREVFRRADFFVGCPYASAGISDLKAFGELAGCGSEGAGLRCGQVFPGQTGHHHERRV